MKNWNEWQIAGLGLVLGILSYVSGALDATSLYLVGAIVILAAFKGREDRLKKSALKSQQTSVNVPKEKRWRIFKHGFKLYFALAFAALVAHSIWTYMSS